MTSRGLYPRQGPVSPRRHPVGVVYNRQVYPEHFDDPVAAYDCLASRYADLSRRHGRYLRAVEREVISRISKGNRSLLDVGAGDGVRAQRIASESGIERIVLVEPSEEMTGKAAELAEVWPLRAEDLAVDAAAERLDVITCLWNVLGHIPTAEKRRRALTAIARLLAPQGRFFLDVNHRYNSRSYRIFPTAARWIHDFLSPSENNGNVLAQWSDAGISTYGHVFTHREIMHLAEAAGLELEERLVIDYEDGRIRRFAFQGNLLYIFRRSSPIDSASAPQTS